MQCPGLSQHHDQPKAKGGIFFGFVLFAIRTTALNYFYVKYFKGLAKG
jgi:hypothetical protein